MIFVTVGTHEQPFDRLVEYIDKWAELCCEDVIIQTGYSTYIPRNSKWQKLFTYKEMQEYVREARIVVTHGGPSSFFMPLQIGKIPIVVPRRFELNEHINNHQVEFCTEVSRRYGNIIVVDTIDDLGETIYSYEQITKTMSSKMVNNNESFCIQFERIINELFSK